MKVEDQRLVEGEEAVKRAAAELAMMWTESERL